MIDTINDIEEVVKAVMFRNAELNNRILFLEAENRELRARLSRIECPEKDSRNSSIPPSKESPKAQETRRTRSLRKPTGRPSGGQPRHVGTTLLMREKADDTKWHNPEYCSCCGESLKNITGEDVETRQSIDVPLPICPIVTNHIVVEKTCSCGQSNRGSFPDYVKPGVSYGVNIHALVVYLSVVQDIPFKRLAGTLKEIYGIELTQLATT